MTDEQRERIAQREQAVAVMASWLRLFIEPGQVTELRALKVRQGTYRPVTVAGFYDFGHLADVVTKALELTRQATGVYFTLNPINPALMGRRANRAATAEDGFCASDKDVLGKHWLLIDTDPVRPAGVSASDAEKALALENGLVIREHLRGLGWPEGIRGDSGNGGHLLYRVDLPADDGGLIKRVLTTLAARFDSESVKLDTSVFNPARICKLYGTLARKGDSIPERPHRRSLILDVPGCAVPHDVSEALVTAVPLELLEALAAEAPVGSKSPAGGSSTTSDGQSNGAYPNRLKVGEWLTARGIEYTVKDLADGRTAYVLRYCPFNPDHTGKDVAIFQDASGKLGAKCFHNSCAGNRWQEFKQRIGPPAGEHFDPPYEPQRRSSNGRGGKRAKASANGVSHGGAPPSPDGAATRSGGAEAVKERQSTHEIISDYFRRHYRPSFRRADVIYSGMYGRPVTQREACEAPGIALANELIVASDAPELTITSNDIDLTPIISHFRKWAPSAYKDLRDTLPEEGGAEEIIATAEEAFREKVAAALYHHASLARVYGDSGETRVERRTLLDWCRIFAKTGRWGDVRGYQVWCRRGDNGSLQIALRKGLFTQVQGCADLVKLSKTRFTQMAKFYVVGTDEVVKKQRAIVLLPEFVAYLEEQPGPDDTFSDTVGWDIPTREGEVSKCHNGGEPESGQGVRGDTFGDTLPADAQSVTESVSDPPF